MEPKVLSSDASRVNIRPRKLRWLPAVVLALVVLLGLFAMGSSARAQDGPEGIQSFPWTTNFCLTGQQCAMGDFNGDGKDDIIQFNHQTSSPTYPGVGAVYVALSNGNGFDGAQGWNATTFCDENNDICMVGDFNGDGRDDVIRFRRRTGDVSVALAKVPGPGFADAETWKSNFCAVGEICDVGDFDGDGRDDIVTFLRSNYADKIGEVRVARSTGGGFGTSTKWASWFCIDQEICGVGDFNGDGRDDVITFRPYQNVGDPYPAPVYVAKSNGGEFVKSNTPWRELFCAGQEICGVGDFNGDGKDDVITYLRSTWYPNKIGWVYVGVSSGSSFPSSTLWNLNENDPFCINQEQCGSGRYLYNVNHTTYSQVARTGDFNGDGRADVITFLQSNYLADKPGWVYVRLAWGNHFVDEIPTGLTPRAWMPFLRH
jgi:hypothetical protein